MAYKKIIIDGVQFSLEQGKIARIYYSHRLPCGPQKPLRFWRLVAGKEKSTWHSFDELPAINALAREMNETGERLGMRYAIPSHDEANALRIWREFCRVRALEGTPFRKSLSTLLESTLFAENEMESTPSLSQAAEKYFAEKIRMESVTERHVSRSKRLVSFFTQELKDCRLSEVSQDAVEAALDTKTGIGASSRRAYMQAIKSLFKWWFTRENSQRKITERLVNPLENLTLPKIRKTQDPEIITPDTLRKMLNLIAKSTPNLLAVCVVQAFCGVRLAEALRLSWSDFRGEYIFLSSKITKTQVARVAPVPKCAQAWFAICPKSDLLATEKLSCVKFTDYRRRALRHSGITLPKNALRHSAASYLSALYGNEKAADICGHDVRTAGVYYRAATTPEIAQEWFSIYPEK
ncbi:MAG: tyrosine-type recombinase/integrase [Opitutae bacterium]|nr:tyrosine-type recombinase/integrase [Opitutae bacterium]